MAVVLQWKWKTWWGADVTTRFKCGRHICQVFSSMPLWHCFGPQNNILYFPAEYVMTGDRYIRFSFRCYPWMRGYLLTLVNRVVQLTILMSNSSSSPVVMDFLDGTVNSGKTNANKLHNPSPSTKLIGSKFLAIIFEMRGCCARLLWGCLVTAIRWLFSLGLGSSLLLDASLSNGRTSLS